MGWKQLGLRLHDLEVLLGHSPEVVEQYRLALLEMIDKAEAALYALPPVQVEEKPAGAVHTGEGL